MQCLRQLSTTKGKGEMHNKLCVMNRPKFKSSLFTEVGIISDLNGAFLSFLEHAHYILTLYGSYNNSMDIFRKQIMFHEENT